MLSIAFATKLPSAHTGEAVKGEEVSCWERDEMHTKPDPTRIFMYEHEARARNSVVKPLGGDARFSPACFSSFVCVFWECYCVCLKHAGESGKTCWSDLERNKVLFPFSIPSIFVSKSKAPNYYTHGKGINRAHGNHVLHVPTRLPWVVWMLI